MRDAIERGWPHPLAIEEHEEETKRLSFLTAQRDDLNSAKTSLQQAIREIDSTARDLFLQTLDLILKLIARECRGLGASGETRRRKCRHETGHKAFLPSRSDRSVCRAPRT